MGVGEALPPLPSEFTSRLGVPVGKDADTIRLGVALDASSEATVADVAVGLAASANAAAPATWGDAMDVPLSRLVAVLLVFQADVMPVPGAKISKQVPKLE